MKKQAGFTIVEIMVVAALIAILSSMVWVSLNNSTAQSRDAKRQADLRTVQAALELYKQEYGRYPEGCNDGDWNVANSWRGNWSGQIGSGYECPGNSPEYIVNDISTTAEVENFAPQFIPVLPTDPKLNDSETYSGYVYTTNPAGSVYKFMALNTVESETVTRGGETLDDRGHPLARCGDLTTADGECAEVKNNNPTQNYSYNSYGGTPAHCTINGGYDNDYAVYGGYAPGGQWGIWRDSVTAREFFSDQIRCK